MAVRGLRHIVAFPPWLALLASCGQQGPLYLPAEEPLLPISPAAADDGNCRGEPPIGAGADMTARPACGREMTTSSEEGRT